MRFPQTMQANVAVVEALIQWLRGTTPERVMDEAAQWLAQGVAEDDLWAAAVLTASHYVNNQAHNLLGFVAHSMVGCADARQLAKGQSRRARALLLMQTLHQTVADLHDPSFGPFELLPYGPLHEATVEESIRWLRADIRMGEYSRADHRIVGLSESLSPEAIADLVLDVGLEGVVTDDHTLISPTLSLSMIELVGWQRGFELVRWAIRYSASFPINFAPYDRCVALMREAGLAAGAAVHALQPNRVEPLCARFLHADPVQRPQLAAEAMAREGCSPATVVAAAAQAACAMYLMIDPVPHADFDAISREVAPIHLGNCLRLASTALIYMRPRTQVLAALQAGNLLARGPLVISADFRYVPFAPALPYPYAEDVAEIAHYDCATLLAYLRDALGGHDCRRATAAVMAYAQQDGDGERMITTLTEMACTDQGTLMHNIKHLNSMVIEFRQANRPSRWKFLVQAAKFMSWYCGLTTDAYARADAALVEHLQI